MLGVVLAVCHIVYFIPIIAGWPGRSWVHRFLKIHALSPRSLAPPSPGAWTIESTGIQYDCNVGTQLRVAVYSLVGLFGLCFLLEVSLTSIGLKGMLSTVRDGCGLLVCLHGRVPTSRTNLFSQ